MLLENIKNLEIFHPKCDSTKEVLHALADLEEDISPALPYLNAELGGWDYDARNHVLLLKLSAGKWITLHSRQLAIRGCRDIAEAQALVEWIKNQVNEIYDRREGITPRYTGQAGLKVMEILKLLPRQKGCRACGQPSCMVFAQLVAEGAKGPEDCLPMGEEARQKLREYLASYGWRALDDG